MAVAGAARVDHRPLQQNLEVDKSCNIIPLFYPCWYMKKSYSRKHHTKMRFLKQIDIFFSKIGFVLYLLSYYKH